MNKDEVKKLMMLIMSTYPNFKVADMKFTVNTWLNLLKEYNAEDIFNGYRAFTLTDKNGFAPTPGQIINNIPGLKGEEMTEGEAWSLVFHAMKNSAYNSVQEYEKLPKVIQKALGSAENLKEIAIDEEFNLSVESSNFKRSYKNALSQQRNADMLPESLRQKVENPYTKMLEEKRSNRRKSLEDLKLLLGD